MSFSELENEALETGNKNLNDLLSIAWARVPGIVPEEEIDDLSMKSLRTLLGNDDAGDCDGPSRQWLADHGVMPLAA
jgi:hypothetical protein